MLQGCFTVTEDAALICAAQASAEKQAQVALDIWLNPQVKVMDIFACNLQFYRPKVIERCEALLEEPTTPAVVGRVAQLLLHLRDPTWVIAAARALSEGDSKTCRNLLDCIDSHLASVFSANSSSVEDAVLSSLTSCLEPCAASADQIVRNLAFAVLCSIRNPVVVPILCRMALMCPQTTWIMRRILERMWFKYHSDDAIIEFCRRIAEDSQEKKLISDPDCLKEDRFGMLFQLAQVLRVCAQKGTETTRAKSVAIAIMLFERWKKTGSKVERNTLPALAEAIGCGATEQDLPWIKEAFSRERHTRSAEGLLAGLARVGGAEGRAELIAALRDPKRQKNAWLSCGIAFKDTGDQEILGILTETALAITASGVVKRIADAIVAIGGSKADLLIDGLQARLDAHDYSTLTKHRALGTAYLVAEEAVSLGLISSTLLHTLVPKHDKYCSVNSVAHYFCWDNTSASISNLESDDELTYFGLLADLKDASKGMFSPTYPSQHGVSETEMPSEQIEWPKVIGRRSFDEEEAGREPGHDLLQFIHAGKLYQVRLRRTIYGANGRTYDPAPLVIAVNHALADAGFAKRFIGINSRGGSDIFAFTDPQVFLPFAVKHKVILFELS